LGDLKEGEIIINDLKRNRVWGSEMNPRKTEEFCCVVFNVLSKHQPKATDEIMKCVPVLRSGLPLE
jgi:hypothetical protein